MALDDKQRKSRKLDEINEINETRNDGTDVSVRNEPHRSLPPGKLYHVFFSYCCQDRNWVIEMVDRLESPEYGFKCCYADRDFDLGIPVFQNITKCIHTSKRTVIVMSPEFLQSPWCSYETRITLELDLDTRQRLLIPVMLRNCMVPDYIGRLTYMEVLNDHFWERFVAAIAEDDSPSLMVQATIGSPAIIAGIPFQYNPYFHNTDEVAEVTIYRGCEFSSGSEHEFLQNELMRNGLQITQSEYREIMTSITRIFYVRCHGFFNRTLYAVPGISALVAVIVLAYFYFSYRPSQDKDTIGIITLTFLICVIALIVVYSLCTLQASPKLPKAIEAGNRIARSRNLMIAVKQYAWCSCTCDMMAMMFYYYDWKPCHLHLTQFLIEHNSRNSRPNGEIPNDSRDSASLLEQGERNSIPTEDEVWDLLVKHATEYCQLLLNRRSETPSEQRHTRQGECLCQFVESILVSGGTSCCDRIFGVRSRHPWKRYCVY